jgi:hypothetical protein
MRSNADQAESESGGRALLCFASDMRIIAVKRDIYK